MNADVFKTKRLLFLGATQFQIPAVKAAQKLGAQVIVTDNVPSNIGHTIGDFSENVSTTDLEGLLQIAKKYRIDGVMTYGSDVSTPGVAYVAEKLKLAGNPFEAALLLQRKDEFRYFQKNNHLPHPSFFVVNSDFNIDGFICPLNYPFLVKPSDSSGSKGQTIVHTVNELEKAISEAKKFSRCGIVICEEFLQGDILELDGDALIQNGKLSFAHYGHNYFLKKTPARVPIGEIMPGFFNDDIVRKIDNQLKVIIEGFKLNTGCINFDALVVDNEVVILDIGLRNGGNYVPDLIKMSTGVDLTEAAVYCAFGMDYSIDHIHVKNPKPVMTYILNAKEEGRFSGIRFAPDIAKYVKQSINFVEFETHVKPFIRGDYALGVVFLEFGSVEEMQNKWHQVEDLILVDIIPENDTDPLSENQSNYKRYKERISPFLQRKLKEARDEGRFDVEKILSLQFVFNENEKDTSENTVSKHYDAAADFIFEGKKMFGVERLYKRQIVVDITLKCIAHCRHCLRRNYDPFILSNDDLSRIARFIGKSELTKDVREILITGGDPFLVPKKLSHFLLQLEENVPFLETARIASRLPVHQPDWVNENVLSVLKKNYNFRIEMATQINHSFELFPEVRTAYKKIRECVSAIYNQTVLLEGINNNVSALIQLFDDLRSLGIENHYLFHCVPITGIDWLRTNLDETINLANKVSSSGLISGRVKPQVALMTDIGKITLYEKAIIKRENNKILLRSNYSLKDRLSWNPLWELPESAQVEKDGTLSVWYKDK